MAQIKKSGAAKVTARYHRGNVAEDLLKAAFRLLETERFEDISARRLCLEIGVTPANFYNHYSSLNHLMEAVAARGFEMRAAQNLRTLNLGLSREEALMQLTQTMVDFAIEHSELFRIMFGQLTPGPAALYRTAKSRKAFGVVVQVIYGADIYRADDVAWSHNNCILAYSFFSFSYGLARLLSMGEFAFASSTRAEQCKFVEDVTHGFLGGLPPLSKAGARAKAASLARPVVVSLEKALSAKQRSRA